MRFSYKELNSFFVEPLPEVNALAKVLTDHSSEVEEIMAKDGGDWEMEIKILPDRTGDAKTSLGLAHEISALLPELKLKIDWPLATGDTARTKIVFTVEQITNLLGVALTKEQVVGFLNRVRVTVIENADHLLALVPPERLDLNIKEDLADEVARLYGYDQVPARILNADIPIRREKTFDLANKVRAKFVAEGYTEIYGYTFTDHGEVEVLKALASDKSFLRSNLSDGLKKMIEFNLGHTIFDQDEVKVFEIGSVFVGGDENIMVAIGTGSKKPTLKIEVEEKKLTDFSDLKNDHQELESLINRDIHYRPVSIYPRIVRDVAVWVPAEVVMETVAKVITDSAGSLLSEGPYKFDEFAKEGRASLAFRLVLQSTEKTLSDEEAGEVMEKVTKALQKEGWEVR